MLGKKKVDWPAFYDSVDFDALYEDLGWVPLTSSGTEDKGYCLDPWKLHKHGDRTGKLAINRSKGVYNCWVCGGGTILTLVMEVKGLDFDGTLEYLSRFINAFNKESVEEFHARISRLLDHVKDRHRPIPIFNTSVLSKFDKAEEWGESRGISAEVVDYFNIGMSLTHHKFNSEFGAYEGQAVILPHFWHGKLVGWQERWLSDTPRWIGKYTNTGEFPRETTVWGLDFAQSQKVRPVLCESVATALRLISEGFPAIATFGSQITPDQCKNLRGFQQGIILAPDNDIPGYKWYTAAIKELHKFVPLYLAEPLGDLGTDLGDVARSDLLSTLADVKDVYLDYIISGDSWDSRNIKK